MRILGTILVLCCIAAAAGADRYPSRAVRVIVAAPPGGLTDIVARSVSQFLHEKYGQPFVVENVAGASSTIRHRKPMRATPITRSCRTRRSWLEITSSRTARRVFWASLRLAS